MRKLYLFAFFALLICVCIVLLFYIMNNKPELTLDKQIYKLNDVIKMSYSHVPVNKNNWIGIWHADNIEDGPWHQKQSKSCVIWEYTSQKSDHIEIVISKNHLTPGRYAAFLLSNNGYSWLSNPIIFDIADQNNNIKFKTLALNIWREGTMVPDGFNGIVNEIFSSGADISLLSEVRNYNGDFMQRLIDAMNSKGIKFYTYHSASDVGVLSRFPIKNYTCFDHCTKTLIDINDVTVAFYLCHLDYLNYAPYYYRGFDYDNEIKLAKPETDVGKILTENNKSSRLASIVQLIYDAMKEMALGRVVTINGDFNEPSPLDYIYETRNMYEHNGVIVPWNTTKLLLDMDYKDAYRAIYPDPVEYPGITWPSDNSNKDVEEIIEIVADVRDRIDYTFYYPDRRLILEDVVILGPSKSVACQQRIEEIGHDKFMKPKGEWPSDHKGVLTTFTIGNNSRSDN